MSTDNFRIAGNEVEPLFRGIRDNRAPGWVQRRTARLASRILTRARRFIVDEAPGFALGAACSRIGLSGEVASPKARGRISLLFITPLLSPSVELPKGFTWAKNVLAVELNRA